MQISGKSDMGGIYILKEEQNMGTHQITLWKIFGWMQIDV
jgi:hypothetical protein